MSTGCLAANGWALDRWLTELRGRAAPARHSHRHDSRRWRRLISVMRYSILFSLVSAFTSCTLRAEDWPQLRCPTGQGHSAERGLSVEWSETRNVMWKTPVAGLGWSSPVIAEGRVWLTTAIDERGAASLRAMAFDVETGRE